MNIKVIRIQQKRFKIDLSHFFPFLINWQEKGKSSLGENSENECSVRQSVKRLLVMTRDASSSIVPCIVCNHGIWDKNGTENQEKVCYPNIYVVLCILPMHLESFYLPFFPL